MKNAGPNEGEETSCKAANEAHEYRKVRNNYGEKNGDNHHDNTEDKAVHF